MPLRIKERTLEKWEQARAKPNPQAAALVLLVRRYPDTLERLEKVAAGCPRCINGGDTGSGYETCICIHAEQRAIADAARRGISTDDSVLYVNLRPCLQCLVIAKASGVREIFYSGEEWTYPDEIEQIYHALCEQFDSFTRTNEREGSQLGGRRAAVP